MQHRAAAFLQGCSTMLQVINIVFLHYLQHSLHECNTMLQIINVVWWVFYKQIQNWIVFHKKIQNSAQGGSEVNFFSFWSSVIQNHFKKVKILIFVVTYCCSWYYFDCIQRIRWFCEHLCIMCALYSNLIAPSIIIMRKYSQNHWFRWICQRGQQIKWNKLEFFFFS